MTLVTVKKEGQSVPYEDVIIRIVWARNGKARIEITKRDLTSPGKSSYSEPRKSDEARK